MSNPIRKFSGPVIDHDCNMICDNCCQSICKGKLPWFALAKGMWIGKVPQELGDLNWIKWMLIVRVQHNSCFVRVSSGHTKMVAHVVAFESSIQKVYMALPPQIADLNNLLAVLFTGPCMPQHDEFKCLEPLLV